MIKNIANKFPLVKEKYNKLDERESLKLILIISYRLSNCKTDDILIYRELLSVFLDHQKSSSFQV